MGVYIELSTKIFNRMTKEITYGRVPKDSVVVPGSCLQKMEATVFIVQL